MSHDRNAATKIPGLDEVLGGGFTRGRLFLVEGVPGSGKTTLALQFLMAAAARGEPVLYVTLSETEEELRAVATSHGWALEGITVHELIPSEAALEPDEQYTMFHASEVELGATMQAVLKTVDVLRPTCVVIDSLSELRLLAGNALRYRRQILALKQFFVGRSCTAMLLDDMTSREQDLQMQSIAHGVVRLEQISPEYGSERRRLRVVKYRGMEFRGGYHDYLIRKGGIEVFPRLVASEYRRTAIKGKLASEISGLDSLLGGGIEQGTSTLIVGAAGTGKSTLAAQFAAAAAARGQRTAIFAFDESRSILLARSKGLGLTIEEGRGPGEIMIRQIDPAEVAPGEFAQLVRAAVQDDQARVVIIDSLNGYLNAMPEDQFLTAQLHELLSFLNNEGVATFLIVAQSGLMGGNMRAPVDASYLADAVVMMRMYEHVGKVKKAISVLKKRSGSHEEAIRQIWFDAEGIHLSEPLTQLRGVLSGVPVDISGPVAARGAE